MAEETTDDKEYTIGGIKISFPYKAYGTQVSLMDKIVRSLNRRQNCLLESPTGTGKTLALLCASLAWQRNIRRKIEEEDMLIETAVSSCDDVVAMSSNLSIKESADDAIPLAKANDIEGGGSIIRAKESPYFHHSGISRHTVDCKIDGEKPSHCSDDSGIDNSCLNATYSDLDSSKSDCYHDGIQSRSSHDCCDESYSHRSSDSFYSTHTSLHNEKIGSFDIDEATSTAYATPKRQRLSFPAFDDDLDDFQVPKRYKSASKTERFNRDLDILHKASPSRSNEHNYVCETSQSPQASSSARDSDISHKTSLSKSNEQNSISKTSQSLQGSSSEKKCNEPVIKKVPKIFYGSRTHKQIEQVIRELRKTSYKDVKMTILSSRDRTCIHRTVSKMNNKREACDEVVNAVGGPSCVYYRNYRTVNHYNPSSLSQAWDIEDLVQSMRRVRACPYYVSRALALHSEIIFCPYNYLIDPMVRNSLDINLHGNIIIMDEAHNIEDSARDASSFSVTHQELEGAIAELQQVLQTQVEQNHALNYEKSIYVFVTLRNWLVSHVKALEECSSFDIGSKVYSGTDMVAILSNAGISVDNWNDVRKYLNTICQQEKDSEQNEDDADEVKLSGPTLHLIRSFLIVIDYIFQQNSNYIGDYRCVVMRKRPVFSYSQARNNERPSWELSLNFWCLNPAVAFTDLKGSIYNLIVASGTLSPMRSFETEIGMPFDISFAANHVISLNQLWVGTISRGPMGSILNGTFRNTEAFSYQDEIGNLIFEICKVVPNGVLCFVPSYSVLQKLSNRWSVTGLWDRIASKKTIVCEPRGGGTEDFGAIMKEFYDAADSAGGQGALLIAVCRGKVSEGLDFSDGHARAVITVGIPFPNIKDMQIDLKKKHNDSLCSKMNLMSGNEWYEAQAFRALNQALGRCIRHRYDYGALIMVDERFHKQMRYTNSLSKWIRKDLAHFQSFSEAICSLKMFFEEKNYD